MTDFFDDLERQLVERARAGLDTQGRGKWSRRTMLLAATIALLLVAVPAAAVTGVFEQKHHHRHLPAHPGLVDVEAGGECAQKNPQHGHTTTKPPPNDLLALLAVLRRPPAATDKLPDDRLGLESADGVNPDYVRRVVSSNGIVGYLVP